jgi:Tfp pilus assembly protein PilZ
MPRRLKLRFEDAAAFRDEYRGNIVQGGAFVRTLEQLSLREPVLVEIELAFCGETAELEAEVVHCVPPEQAGGPAAAGVAIQFLAPAAELRDRFERYATRPGRDADEGARTAARERPSRSARAGGAAEAAEERRRGSRSRARVPARLDATHVSLEGRTRDLSESGVLLSVDGSDLPVGKKVQLTLVHPDTGEPFEVSGRVARRLEAPGTVAAVAIDFEPGEAGAGFERFVRDVHGAEARRQARGIAGAIEELGMDNLIQMFGKFSRGGTLTATVGSEEGVLSFEAGCLRTCRIGSLTGTKALARMLSWREGSFEFHAEVDPGGEGELIPIDGALLEAARQLDERRRIDPGSLDPTARLRLDTKALSSCGEALSKTEEAVVDLAAAGLTVRRLLDVIPESDAQILDAIRTLAERGLVEILPD